MKILLDESVTRKLKKHLVEFEVKTVVEMGWSGLKNGSLLTAAGVEGFHVLLTIDKNLAHQQTLNDKEIAVVVLGAAKSKIDFLLPLLRTFKDHVDQFENGKAYLIE